MERLAPTLDRLVVVGSFGSPLYKPGLIDRLLVLAHSAEVEPAIILNKADLAAPGEAEHAAAEYEALGYRVVISSSVGARGIDDVRAVIGKGRSALCGHSGVGKSTLLKAVDPGVTEDVETGAVSRSTGKGRHTTTRVRVWRLSSGAEVIDLPGIKLLDLAHLDPEDVYAAFPETATALGRCQFADCAHGPEPGCAVKVALADRSVSPRRRASLERILESLRWR